MGETQERIADAKSKDIDIDDYIAERQDEVDDLKKDMDDKWLDKEEAKGLKNSILKNTNYVERQQIIDTKKVFENYNKILNDRTKILQDLAKEIGKNPIDTQKIGELNTKKTELETKLETQKQSILSSKIKFDDNDKIKVSLNGRPTQYYSLKECLNNNLSIKDFIDGTVEKVNGGTATPVDNLDSKEHKAFSDLLNDINTKPELTKIRARIANHGFSVLSLSEAELKTIVNEVEQNYAKARIDYVKTKKERDTKKDSLKVLNKEKELLSAIQNNSSVDEIWNMKKMFSKNEKNQLQTIADNRHSRYTFWRNSGSGVIASWFKSVFQKQKTIDSYKYMKVEEKKNIAKRKQDKRNNIFRSELIKTAKNKSVTEVDVQRAYKNIREDELDK